MYDPDGLLVNTFSSTRKAGGYFKCSQTTIIKYLKNNKLFLGKWYLSKNKDFLISSINSSDSDKYFYTGY